MDQNSVTWLRPNDKYKEGWNIDFMSIQEKKTMVNMQYYLC